MWQAIKAIFGSGEIVTRGFELIDDLHTSGEERIEAVANAKVRMLEAYAPFKLAQRVLAFAFGFVFLASFGLVLGMTLAGMGDVDSVRAVLSEFWIGEIMLIIITFYFGGGAVEGVMERFKK